MARATLPQARVDGERVFEFEPTLMLQVMTSQVKKEAGMWMLQAVCLSNRRVVLFFSLSASSEED